MSYKITIQPSNHVFDCEEDESILEAGLRQGFAMPYGCRNGGCGSCKGKLLAGEIDYGGELPQGINQEEADAGFALFCQAYPMSDITVEIKEIGEAKDITIKILPVRVMEMDKLNHDVMLLKLKTPAAEEFKFLAGQYINVLLRDGGRRGFSLANAPHDKELLELHIRHVEGGQFTSYVFNEMQPKALLRIEGPLGSFILREESERPLLFIAGGTGFAPIKSLLEHAFYKNIQRPMHFFWGVRAKRDIYTQLPEQWAEQHSHFQYTPALSQPLPEDNWQGETGYIHEVVLKHYSNLKDFDIYMSGPPIMIESSKKAFVEHGLNEEHLFYDSFEFASQK